MDKYIPKIYLRRHREKRVEPAPISLKIKLILMIRIILMSPTPTGFSRTIKKYGLQNYPRLLQKKLKATKDLLENYPGFTPQGRKLFTRKKLFRKTR